ncbi:MAG: alanine--glyoxylate aminotransferase family protein [Cyclobacteriaceae bacterium]|nr:alanine--glyoxylate aminotransferase family protein [Cyclobacteriaceae bacterium]
MITFAPGPSKVYDALPSYLQDAYTQGILSANHRSGVFMDLYRNTESLFREKLQMPADFTLLFTSSATESWEIISQSLVEKASYHLYSGSFGKKWLEYAQYILPATRGQQLSAHQAIPVDQLQLGPEFDLIAVTQNETANASQVPMAVLKALGARYPEKMIAVDTTSSMGGIVLDFTLADVWYASVQKCFGLPAGLGILLLSAQAKEKVARKGERGRYNSLSFMLENAASYQTHYTPNVLGIYLLHRVLQDMDPIAQVDARLRNRMAKLEEAIENSPVFELLVENPATRSTTVAAIAAEEEVISAVKKAAEREGISLGGGYGPLKSSSFRVANFPAITDAEFGKMLDFLASYRQ